MTVTSGLDQMAVLAWSARTREDIDVLLSAVRAEGGNVRWRAVGDKENNIGIIRLASDPATALVERVTNGIDALLELGGLQHPGEDPESPRAAAARWYGVPAKGLGEMNESNRRALGERLQVVLEDSGEQRRPTVVVDDSGCGLSPRLIPKTILSLNEDNKIRKPWLIGLYGQGGSATLGFSRATVIVSRRHPDFNGTEPDRIGWTIVLEEETDPALVKTSRYVYLVDDSGEVFTCSPSVLPELNNGTRIVHVGYDLQSWSGPFTTGIWQFLHAAMFDPVLPFLVAGRRTPTEAGYGSRIVVGNAARLSNPERARGEIQITYSDTIREDLSTDQGSIEFSFCEVDFLERLGLVHVALRLLYRSHGA